jgi:hypothetical protein
MAIVVGFGGVRSRFGFFGYGDHFLVLVVCDRDFF